MINEFRGNRGYVTVMFAVLSIIIVGVISYNIYVSSNVNEIIHLQNSSDISSYTLASYSARGLNFISANNVAIASSLHIATSIPILATYLSAAKVLSQTMVSYGVDKVTTIAGGDSTYQKVWNRLKPIPANYIRISSGLSRVNGWIASKWLGVGYLESINSFSANTKGSDGIIFIGKDDKDENEEDKEDEDKKEKDMEGFFDDIMGHYKQGRFAKLRGIFKKLKDSKDFFEDLKAIKGTVENLKYKGLYQSNASESICFILNGSKKNLKYRRDDLLFWLMGMLPKDLVPQVVRSLSEIESAVQGVLPGRIGYYECGIDMKATNNISVLNGFNYKREFEYFEKKTGDKLGLIVIDDMKEFKKGLKYEGKFWKETRYGIMGKDIRESGGKGKKIVVRTSAEVYNRVEDKEVGLFYPEWYPVLKEKEE